jgi:hypothetical protein
MKNKLLLLVIGIVMTSQMIFSQSWITRPNLPSTDRTAVGSFAIGSKGYYVGGETASSGNLVDTWEYDTASNTWSQKANFPGIGTQKGVAFSINGIGYYGLGTAGGQLYSYNSQNNTWTQKATCNLTGISFWSTTYFVVGTKSYFLDQNNKFFYYDSVADSWTQLSDFAGTKRSTGVGFSINNKGYICTGLNATSAGNTMLNDLWEYNPSNSTWTQKTALPSAGRYASFGFTFNNKGYVLGGERNSSIKLNEFWEYNPTTDSWSSLPNYIGGAKNYLSGFVANSSVYAGFGSPGYGVTFNEYGYFNQSSSFCTTLSGSLTNGLVGYWPFCGNANDDSGNGNNGTVNGATLTTDRFGNGNSAYDFNGGVNFINIPSNNSLDFSLNNKITISLWLNSSVTPVANEAHVLVSKQDGSGLGQIGFNVANELSSTYLLIKNGTSSTQAYSGINGGQLNNGVWHNLVFTFDNGITKAYKDGQLMSQGFTSSIIGASTQALRFGKPTWASLTAPEFSGKLDDIGIWNRALTQEEVTQLYNQNQCITNITVTDTLIINVGQMSYTNPVAYANNITIYPNPASTQININFNNITDLTGGTIKIINSLGQQVVSTPITLTGTSTSMALGSWGGNGIYFVQILNAQGIVVDVKKIILQ